MRCDAGGDQQHFLELERAPDDVGGVQMALVNRVERAAKYPRPSRPAHSFVTETCWSWRSARPAARAFQMASSKTATPFPVAAEMA